MGRIDVPRNTKRRLSWHLTDGNCCMCKTYIGFFEDDEFIGEFAHINDLQKATTRYDENLDIEYKNSKENLLVLCPSCHTKIDKQSQNYSTCDLYKIKNEYELNVKIARDYSNPSYMEIFKKIFKELSKKNLSKGNKENLNNIKIEKKISENDLQEVKQLIEDATKKILNFKDFLGTLSHVEQTELRQSMISIYLNEVDKDIPNIEKFDNILRNIVGTNMRYADYALVIFSYYFEECDVFKS